MDRAMNRTVEWYVKLFEYRILEETDLTIKLFDFQTEDTIEYDKKVFFKDIKDYLNYMINENDIVEDRSFYVDLLNDLKEE